MSIKKLFDKENPYKILSAETLDSVGAVAESSGNINQRLKEKNRFIPIVNFEYPENFARYGKATNIMKMQLFAFMMIILTMGR